LAKRIVFTAHSWERMLQRGINKETVLAVLENPDFVKESFDDRKIAFKKMEKEWQVVFKQEKEKILVISVYFT